MSRIEEFQKQRAKERQEEKPIEAHQVNSVANSFNTISCRGSELHEDKTSPQTKQKKVGEVRGAPRPHFLPGKCPPDQIVSIIDSTDNQNDLERLFRSVFQFAPEKGEKIIEYYIDRDGSTRFEAMRTAIRERREDNTRT